MTDEQFETAIRNAPRAGFEYEHACNRMTDEQFDHAIKCGKGSHWALLCECSTMRMSDEQFEFCIKEDYYSSLKHEHVCDRMTDEQFERSFKTYVSEENHYQYATERHLSIFFLEHVCKRMTDEQFELLRKLEPFSSLDSEYAFRRMNDQQFEESRKAEPWVSLAYSRLCERMTDEQFEDSLKSQPKADGFEHVATRRDLISAIRRKNEFASKLDNSNEARHNGHRVKI